MHTITDVRRAFDAAGLSEQGATYVATWLDNAPERKTAGLKTWLQSHHGDTIETLQINHDGRSAWAPGARTLDSRRRGSAAFFHGADVNVGSWRYYAGMSVIVSDARMMVAADDSSFVLYRVVA